MKRVILTVFALALSLTVIAQAPRKYELTLDESIEIAQEKSYRMLRLREDFKIAEFNLKSAKAKLRTHINMDLTLPEYREGMQTDRMYDPETETFYNVSYMEKRMGYSGGLTINQPLPTNGSIYVSSGILAEDYIKNKTNDFNQRNARITAEIGFRQPIDALYGYNAVKAAIKRAELNYEQSSKSLKREELDLIYNVSNSYYSLLSRQKSTEIALLDLERQREAYETSRKKYDAGLIREVDHLLMEVELDEAQSSYDMAILSQSSGLNDFIDLLGLELNSQVVLNNSMDFKAVDVDPDKAVEYALANRLEIREQEIIIELQKLSIKQQKSENLIKGAIEGSIGRRSGTQRDTLSFSEAFHNAYDDFKRNPSFALGFTISIPIFDWGENRSLVRAAEARQKQNVYRKYELERSIETDIRNLAASLKSNLKRLQLLEKTIVVAEKSFEITLQRYNDGEIDSQSLAQERSRVNKTYNSHLNAYITYQLALADIMRKTFYDFKNDVPIQ